MPYHIAVIRLANTETKVKSLYKSFIPKKKKQQQKLKWEINSMLDTMDE